MWFLITAKSANEYGEPLQEIAGPWKEEEEEDEKEKERW